MAQCQSCGEALPSARTAHRKFCGACKAIRQKAANLGQTEQRRRRLAEKAEQRRLNPTAPCVDCGAAIELGRLVGGPTRHVCKPCKVARKSARYYRKAEQFKAKQAAYYKANREEIRAKARERFATDPVYQAKVREWSAAGRPRALEYKKHRYRTDPQFRLVNNIRAAIWRGLAAGQKHGRTFDVLGYTVQQLRAHLEKRFTKGMTWDNYGEWHVDHIIPLIAFNYETTSDIDFKKAWSLKNLQPLWKSENQSKHAKLAKPFQPSLLLMETYGG